MKPLLEDPLEVLDEETLYWLLGEAWVAQLRPRPNSVHYLGPSSDVGRREFDALVPQLRFELGRRAGLSTYENVKRTLENWGTWRVPSAIVYAIALRRGIVVKPDHVAHERAGSSNAARMSARGQ